MLKDRIVTREQRGAYARPSPAILAKLAQLGGRSPSPEPCHHTESESRRTGVLLRPRPWSLRAVPRPRGPEAESVSQACLRFRGADGMHLLPSVPGHMAGSASPYAPPVACESPPGITGRMCLRRPASSPLALSPGPPAAGPWVTFHARARWSKFGVARAAERCTKVRRPRGEGRGSPTDACTEDAPGVLDRAVLVPLPLRRVELVLRRSPGEHKFGLRARQQPVCEAPGVHAVRASTGLVMLPEERRACA